MDLFFSWMGHLGALPYPTEDCTDRVIIVTGSNTGLGLETARHFVRLNASKVILACRDPDRADKAKQDIEESTQRTGVVETWQLDLCSFESVREFAARAAQLERLDILVNNASVLADEWRLVEGHESQVTVNIISTVLLSLLVLPTLRRTGVRDNVVPRIVIVSSEGAYLSFARELKAQSIMGALDSAAWFYGPERYGTTKLLQVMAIRKLAEAVDASGKGHVLVNGVNPGLCRTRLFRDVNPLVGSLSWLAGLVFGRTAEMGSRTLMSAAFAGEATHGAWMTNCRVFAAPGAMRGDRGSKATDRFWGELMELLEGVEPGVTQNI